MNTLVQCLKCGNIISISDKVDEMISLKSNNPNISFHPTYYNQCPACRGNEVEEVTTYDLRKETLYRVYCPDCGKYSYFKYKKKTKENPNVTNPFTDYKCTFCGSKQGILMERRGHKFEY